MTQFLISSALSSISFFFSLFLVSLNDLRFPKFMMLFCGSEVPAEKELSCKGEGSRCNEPDSGSRLWREAEAASVAAIRRHFCLAQQRNTNRFWCQPASQEWNSCANSVCSIIYLSKPSFLSYKRGIIIIPAFRATEGIKYN